MGTLRLFVLLQLCVFVASQRTELDSPFNLFIYRQFRNWLFENLGARREGRTLAARRRTVQDVVPENVPFPCNVTGGRSSKVPESVHRLRPGDIDVIAAMGDSLTAGNGVYSNNILEVLIENRGVAANIGGEGTWRTHLTLPNILKEFNPKLIGYALGDSTTSNSASQLDVAELGAMSKDLTFMAKYLINKMKRDPRIDIKKHWKFISIFVGSNDFCTEFCSVPSLTAALEQHRIDMVNTLRILRDNLPRTFIALHVPPNLKALVDTREGRHSLGCYLWTTIECSCLFALQFRHLRQDYYDAMTRWQNIDKEVANYPEFHRNDFTVVIVPVLQNTGIPLAEDGYADHSYLASDCFHITQKSNARYANGVWNNLLEPIGNKTIYWPTPFKKFLCPTPERPYLVTRENQPKNNEL